MTTVVIPDFIIDLFENEIRNIILKLLNGISTRFNLSESELVNAVSKDMQMDLRIIPEEEEHIKIIRVKPKKQLAHEDRCKGLVKKDGIIRQCAFSHRDASDYCLRHSKKFQANPHVFDELSRQKDNDHQDVAKKIRKVRKLY